MIASLKRVSPGPPDTDPARKGCVLHNLDAANSGSGESGRVADVFARAARRSAYTKYKERCNALRPASSLTKISPEKWEPVFGTG